MANVLRTPDKLVSRVPDFPFKPRDWGGPIGLRLAVEQPDRIGRMVMLNTGLFTAHQKMTDSWMAFPELAKSGADLPVAFLICAGCKRELAADVIAAYEAA